MHVLREVYGADATYLPELQWRTGAPTPAEEFMIHEALEKVLAGEDLTRSELSAVLEEGSSGHATVVQFAALFTALLMKGMTKDEQAAIEEEQRRQAVRPHVSPATCVSGTESAGSQSLDLALVTQFIVGGHDLSRREAEGAMEAILSGHVDDASIASFLAALRFKGETVDEVVGFAKAMRRHATPIFPAGNAPKNEVLVDTAGTGGDGAGTFNISTAAAFVIAGAGVPVAKHGNRSFSSRCGSADVLEALGAKIEIAPARVARSIEEVGIGFMFAPAMHSATRHAMPVRRELRVRTVFNLLGPLTNPAGASVQIVGVYEPSLTELVAQALGELGVRRAFVFHGAEGLDEISISGETYISELRDGSVRNYTVRPEDFGLRRWPLDEIRGGDARRNAEIILRIFAASSHHHANGAHREIVLANSAAALVAAGRATDLLDGVRLAAESIDSGAAREKLEAFIAFTQHEGEHATSGS
jgi:anthranilate phosphoribosyltransferase